MTERTFTVRMPSLRTTPVVFASPHSGRDYSRAFRRTTILDDRALRSSEDAFIDELFAAAPDHGAPLIAARVPRAYVDLNRGSEEMDPALVRGVARLGQNPRVSSGLGVIPRVVAGARPIYRGKIALDDAQARIRDHWHPYHARLMQLIHESVSLFGQAILIDCHSMPHEAVHTLSRSDGRRPEVVLGDRFGAAAARNLVDAVEAAFVSAGLTVLRNKPFAGAYTAQAYGRPSRNQHVVQVEIDRSLYMNEAEIRPNGNFTHLARLLDGIIGDITQIGQDEMPLAAE